MARGDGQGDGFLPVSEPVSLALKRSLMDAITTTDWTTWMALREKVTTVTGSGDVLEKIATGEVSTIPIALARVLERHVGTLPPGQDDRLPPAIEPQGPGPRFALDDGIIHTVPSQALGGRDHDYRRLEALRAPLREALVAAQSSLGRAGNAFPYAASQLDAYIAELDKPVPEIDYNHLYARGLLLADAVEQAEDMIARGTAPEFDIDQIAPLKGALALHGPFILASEDGRELVLAAERYARTPAEEAQLRDDLQNVIDDLASEPGIVGADAAARLREGAEFGEDGQESERAYVYRRGMGKNLATVMAAASVVGGLSFVPVAGPFMSVAASLFVGISPTAGEAANELKDDALERYRRIADFLARHRTQLRNIAGNSRESAWLQDVIDWTAEKKAEADRKSVSGRRVRKRKSRTRRDAG